MIILFFIGFINLSSNRSKRVQLEHLENSRFVFNYNLQTKRCAIFYSRTLECTSTIYESTKAGLRLLVHTKTQVPFKLEFREQSCSYLNKNLMLTNVKNKRRIARFFAENNDQVINRDDFVVEACPTNSVYAFEYKDFLTLIETPTFRVATSQEREKVEREIVDSSITQNLVIGVCLPDIVINDISTTVLLLMKERNRNERVSIHKIFDTKFVYLVNIDNNLEDFFDGFSFRFSEKDIRIVEKNVNWNNLTFEGVIEFLQQLCDSKILPFDYKVYRRSTGSR